MNKNNTCRREQQMAGVMRRRSAFEKGKNHGNDGNQFSSVVDCECEKEGRRRSRTRVQEERQRLVVMPRGMVGVEEWFGGFQQQQGSLSLLPCQSVTPSYDPGESVFVCLSLSTTSFSLYMTTSTNNNSYLFFSLYLFICLPSLSLSSYLSSPCIHALIPFSAYPLSPFFHSSHAIPLPASI